MNFIACCENQCRACGYCNKFLNPKAYEEEERGQSFSQDYQLESSLGQERHLNQPDLESDEAT